MLPPRTPTHSATHIRISPSISVISVQCTKTSVHTMARHVYTQFTPTSVSAAKYLKQKRWYNIIPIRDWTRLHLFWLRNTRMDVLLNAKTGSHSTPAMFATRGCSLHYHHLCHPVPTGVWRIRLAFSPSAQFRFPLLSFSSTVYKIPTCLALT